MKRFKFNFEKLLIIKEHFETKAKLKYAATLQKKLNYESENRNIENNINNSITDSYKKYQDGDKISFNDMKKNYLHCAKSRSQIFDYEHCMLEFHTLIQFVIAEAINKGIRDNEDIWDELFTRVNDTFQRIKDLNRKYIMLR